MVELLIGTTIFVGGTGALLLAMHQTMRYSEYLSQRQLMMNTVQGRMEQLAAMSFDTLRIGSELDAARPSEDANNNGRLDPGEDTNGNGRLDVPKGLAEQVTALPNGFLTIQVRYADPLDTSNPSLLDLHVAACWRGLDRRFITGEDANCNGQMDVGEDTNGNGWLDAPVELSTRITR